MDDKKEKIQQLKDSINDWKSQRYDGQRHWSFVHHVMLFGSIICSLLAGAFIQLEYSVAALVFTTLAAVLTGIASSGGFERKWRSNRISRSRADCLLLEIENEGVDLDSIRKKLAIAIEKHDLEIVGDKDESVDT